MLLEELIPGENLETSTTEFKGMIEEGGPEKLRWLHTLASFANTKGGVLYVGVEDRTHKIVALDHVTADKASLMIHRQIEQKIEPRLDYRIEPIPVPGNTPTRYILKVMVKKSSVVPVTVRSGNGLLGIYVRRNGRTDAATPEQIREMVLSSDTIPFDQPFTQVAYEQSSFSLLDRRHMERTGEPLNHKELISCGFMSEAGRLSKGALLFADDYSGERTRVVATLWPSDTKGGSTVLASEEFSGNILAAIDFAQSFVANHSANGFRKTADSREDYIAYPPRSVTEGIVNAFAHRNYFIQGSQIEVNVFKDRLEITSPGALLGVRVLVREHNIASIVPRRRNEVICAVLASCKLMEQKGSGFDKIEEDYAGRGEAYRPSVTTDADSFTLCLPDLTYDGGVVGDGNDSPAVRTNAIVTVRNGLKILSYCYRTPRTAAEIANRVGVKPSTYFRNEVLSTLIKGGFLRKDETGRTATYLANTDNVFLE